MKRGIWLALMGACGVFADVKNMHHRLTNVRQNALSSMNPSKSLVVDDGSTNTTSVSPSASPQVIDGNQRVWLAGDWGECDTACGTGVQSRRVTCMDNTTMTVLDDSVCVSDQFVIPSVRPDTEQECQGRCVTCDDHDSLFRSIGLAPAPSKPVAAGTGKVCSVVDPDYSCCDKIVENSMITQVVAIQRGFQEIPTSASKQVATTLSAVQNSTTDFAQRKIETQSLLDSVTATLASPGNLKSSVDKYMAQALTTMHSVLTQRLDDLDTAISNSTQIVNLLTQQLTALQTNLNITQASNVTTGSNSTGTPLAVNQYNITQSSGRTPQLSDCIDASVHMFTSLSCAACNPSFVSDALDNLYETDLSAQNITSAPANLGSQLQIGNTMCQSLFKECSPTIRLSRSYLRQALGVMSGIHMNLAMASVRVQPALLAMWSTMTMDWLPGSAYPLSNVPGNTQGYVPDITSLDCIRNLDTFVLNSTTQMSDFCDNYFGNWNYHFTIQGILKDVTKGVAAYNALTLCDKCFHVIVTKLTDILANSGGAIDVTLALNTDALAEAGCFGLSSTPANRQQAPVVSSSTVPANSFFALSPGELFKSKSQQALINHKSQRAFSMILAGSKLFQARNQGVISVNDTASLALAQNPLFVVQLNFTDTGIDPTIMANVSWDIINNAPFNPPPAVWDIRSGAEIAVVASDLNCTSHSTCNLDGNTPYWYCANAKVCNGTVPCDQIEAELLNVHPRCVQGLCVDDAAAVDGHCPDIATCPVTKTAGQFDHTYFSKFKNIAPQLPPDAVSVGEQGAVAAAAQTIANNYARGVCDCAFGQKSDSSGQPALYVADECMYAACVAYAQKIESSTTCVTALSGMCTKLQSQCPNVQCDAAKAQWNIPTCELSTQTNSQGYAMASESSKSAVVTIGGTGGWFTGLLIIVLAINGLTAF